MCRKWFFYNNSQEIHWLIHAFPLLHWYNQPPDPEYISHPSIASKNTRALPPTLLCSRYSPPSAPTMELWASWFWVSEGIRTLTPQLWFDPDSKDIHWSCRSHWGKPRPAGKFSCPKDVFQMIWTVHLYICEVYQTNGISRSPPGIRFAFKAPKLYSSCIRTTETGAPESLWVLFDPKISKSVWALPWRCDRIQKRPRTISWGFLQICKPGTWLPSPHPWSRNPNSPI